MNMNILRKATDAQLEMMARACPEWREFRKVQMQKLKEAGAAKIKYDNRLRRWETIRSCLSLKREEIKRGL